ncbi:hypothetical protein OG885_00840 [Streptomyces sp. NBC_00028]|uniref:hypothetical protein n=1 Tax=Streptomyces sp. NBC_00028 TaxID=2975624 RepID=UPI00324CA7B9
MSADPWVRKHVGDHVLLASISGNTDGRVLVETGLGLADVRDPIGTLGSARSAPNGSGWRSPRSPSRRRPYGRSPGSGMCRPTSATSS